MSNISAWCTSIIIMLSISKIIIIMVIIIVLFISIDNPQVTVTLSKPITITINTSIKHSIASDRCRRCVHTNRHINKYISRSECK